MLKPSLIAKYDPAADKEQIRQIGDVRITYLSSRLLRIETGEFTDEASCAVKYRRFPAGKMETEQSGKYILVQTEDILLTIKNKVPYSVILEGSKAEAVLLCLAVDDTSVDLTLRQCLLQRCMLRGTYGIELVEVDEEVVGECHLLVELVREVDVIKVIHPQMFWQQTCHEGRFTTALCADECRHRLVGMKHVHL